MPHVALVPFTGLRICRDELRELGFSLPGLRRRGTALAELPALGLLTLAGMLPEDWTCSYHPTRGRPTEALVEEIAATRPALVALSALTASILPAYELADRLRVCRIPVAMGGLHISTCADEGQQHADAVVVGRGEPVWQELLSDAALRRLNPRYVSNQRPLPQTWPLPRFDLLGAQPPRFTVQTQRGCPLACDFCAASRLLGSFDEKPLSNIAKELQLIQSLVRRPVIELADDNTFAGDRDALGLCDTLGAANVVWFTESDWRIGERPELLARMADAGCVQVLLGVESLTFRYPGMGAKHDCLSRIMNAVSAIQDAGIAVNGCFILGAEGETRASMDRLIAFLLESPFADIQLTVQTPFPGTQLRRRLATEGRLLSSRDWNHYTLLDVTFQPDQISVAELEHGFMTAVRAVYSQEATARREAIRRRIWNRNPSLRKSRA